MSFRYGTDYFAQLPDAAPVRCNPVNAPSDCARRRLEPRDDTKDDVAGGRRSRR
jgi:hypothetical protein